MIRPVVKVLCSARHLDVSCGEGVEAAHVDTRDAVEALTLAVALARQGQGSEDDVDKELVQVAAVIVQWIEARAVRRALAAGPRTTVDDTALAHGWDADGREVR